MSQKSTIDCYLIINRKIQIVQPNLSDLSSNSLEGPFKHFPVTVSLVRVYSVEWYVLELLASFVVESTLLVVDLRCVFIQVRVGASHS